MLQNRVERREQEVRMCEIYHFKGKILGKISKFENFNFQVIDLYICESFPDLEVNGVDVFGGWEGEGQAAIALDTADPVVIARFAKKAYSSQNSNRKEYVILRGENANPLSLSLRKETLFLSWQICGPSL